MAIENDEPKERSPRLKQGLNWTRFLMEFFSIFFAVILAFALNNWNDTRKTRNAETNILKEIANGLKLDALDVEGNLRGHKEGLKAVNYFRNLVQGKPVAIDSIYVYRFLLMRDFISIQNTSGYESLKSQGLDIIEDDQLRVEVISLYEYNYNLIEKIEEQYASQQFFETYANRIDNMLAPSASFDELGQLETLTLPLVMSEKEKNRILIDLNSMEYERLFTLSLYEQIARQIKKTKALVYDELSSRN